MRIVDPLLLSVGAYGALGEKMAAAGGFTRGQVVVEPFPDGELYHRIETEVASRDVVLVGGTVDDTSTLELFDVASGVVAAGAHTLTMVVPYFGYSTMERSSRRGEVVKAKTRARLFSSIPSASGGNRMVLLDLHASGTTYYFEGAVRPVLVNAHEIVAAAARRLTGHDTFVLGCTDAGRAKWVEALANRMGVEAAFVFKRRIDGEHTAITGVSAHVDGRDVVIYDDMIRTGGSLVQAARAYREAGARRLWAVATHGVFPPGALERIRDSGLFDRVVTTDSHPRACALAGGILEVDTVAQVLVDKVLE